MAETPTAPSKQRCADLQQTRESLIREWIAKLAVNAGASLDAKTQAVFASIWIEGLSDLPPNVLQAAFQETLRACPYWPIKVADIRKHVIQAKETATADAAERAWQRVLEIRRVDWSVDIPGPFNRALAGLSERVRQAARAAGVFRDFDSVDDLHTWAKKRFVESFISWDELQQSKHLLPDGEIKSILAGCAEMKALPSPKKPKALELSPEEQINVATERRAELQRQGELIKARYPKPSDATAHVGERPEA